MQRSTMTCNEIFFTGNAYSQTQSNVQQGKNGVLIITTKHKKSVKANGEKAKNGVILITTSTNE